MAQLNVEVNEFLPYELKIKSIDELLFDIGLSIKPFSDEHRKRSLIYNPILIFISLVLFLILKFCCLTVDDNNPYSIYLFDFSKFFGFKYHFNLSVIVFTLSAIWLEINYYVNHKRGVKRTFIKVFQMLSGSISPASLGFDPTGANNVFKLVKYSRIAFALISLMRRSVPLFVVFVAFMPYVLNLTLIEAILFGIPSYAIMTFIGNYLVNIFAVTFTYLFVICLYLRLKLQNINMYIGRKNNWYNISKVLRLLNNFYNEVNEYNDTYWSNFLLNIWLLFGLPAMIWINALVLLPLSLFYKSLLIYLCFSTCLLFWSTLYTTAALNYEEIKTNRALRLFVVGMNSLPLKPSLKNKIKVKRY